MGGTGSGRHRRGSGTDKPSKDTAEYMRIRRANEAVARKAAADAATRASHLPVEHFFRGAAGASATATGAGSSTSSGVVRATGTTSGANLTSEDITTDDNSVSVRSHSLTCARVCAAFVVVCGEEGGGRPKWHVGVAEPEPVRWSEDDPARSRSRRHGGANEYRRQLLALCVDCFDELHS